MVPLRTCLRPARCRKKRQNSSDGEVVSSTQRRAQALLDEADVRHLGDLVGIEGGLGDVHQRLQDFVGDAVAPDALEIERQEGIIVHHVGLRGVHEELEHDAVGENAELGGGHGVAVGAQLAARFRQIGADLLGGDGDDRRSLAQHRQVDAIGLLGIGVGRMLRIDLVRIGVVVSEQADDRQHQIQLGAFLVAACAHQAH